MAIPTIHDAHTKLTAGETTARSLASDALRCIEADNDTLNAYLETYADVTGSADAADARRSRGEAGSLLGIPIAVKDNILVAGETVSAGSKMLAEYMAVYDATAISKLKDAGAVLVGRTNMDEFAMGSSTENSAYGPTRNPAAPERVPGGSSGGSAASVAMGSVPCALGSDTGGSIRAPAAFCGVVGLKPTYGSVSRYGLIAMGSSLDVIGPITRTAGDAETVFTAISGYDPRDATSVPDGTYEPVVPSAKRIGVPQAFLDTYLEADVRSVYEVSLQRLTELGYELVDIELPNPDDALAAYYIIMFAESSTNLARFDGVRYGLYVPGENLGEDYRQTRAEGFGPEVRRRIMMGTYVLSAGYVDAYYGKAQAVRQTVANQYAAALSDVDSIAMPTTPAPAFRLGEKADPLSVYLTDVFTVPANLTGMPALSVPAGETPDGLPLGLQFMGPHASEARLCALGRTFLGEDA